jgi:hypothetical protein
MASSVSLPFGECLADADQETGGERDAELPASRSILRRTAGSLSGAH